LKRLLLAVLLLFFIFPIVCKADGFIPIIMYHHVRDVEKGYRRAAKDLSCPPELFKNHLDYLESTGYKTITFKDVMLGLVPQKPVILTFDDGTYSHWCAFQKLSERRMLGVFFIISGFIGERTYLNLEQLKAMVKGGMEIGSHTETHPNLNRISQERLSREVMNSKLDLERLLEVNVISFAYPFGKYSKKVMEEVEKSGYRYGRTTNEGVSEFGNKPNFELKMIYIHNHTTDLSRVLK